MKSSFAVAALLGFFSAVYAQAGCDATASKVPACGQGCLLSAQTQIGCGAKDYACGCKSSSALQSAAQSCVIASCGVETALQVQSSASAICQCVATATSAPASSSATPTPSSTPSSTPASSSGSASSASPSGSATSVASSTSAAGPSSSAASVSAPAPSGGACTADEVVTVTVTVTDTYAQ